MNEIPADFAAFLEASRRAYVAALPGKIAGLEALWSAAAGGGDLVELERGAHSVAGTAGTFGLARIGEAGRTVELAVRRLAAAEPVDFAARRAEVAAALEHLRHTVDAGPA